MLKVNNLFENMRVEEYGNPNGKYLSKYINNKAFVKIYFSLSNPKM